MVSDLLCYKTMPVWNAQTVPEGFRRKHNTREGTWAQLKVLQGRIGFAMLEDTGEVVSEHVFTPQAQPPLIQPGEWHRIVDLSEDAECQLSFLCTPEDYFSKKHGLSRTHSEVIEAVQHVSPGRTLDVGCGSGRNTLYLRMKGFKVEAWDHNSDGLATLQRLALEEGLAGNAHELKLLTGDAVAMPELSEEQPLLVRQVDLNKATITGQYDFLLSTVVLMFLQPETIPGLIAQMQQATVPGGHNLIVAAMDTPDYPCTVPFPFRFSAGELQSYYEGWEFIKYNENPGSLHRKDENGNFIQLRFATMLARKPV